MKKPQPPVQADGCDIGAIADDRDHLAASRLGTSRDKSGEQRATDAAPGEAMGHVDRILHCKPVGGARSVWSRIAVADHLAVHFRHEIGEPMAQYVGATAMQFIDRGRFFFERCETVKDMKSVDCLDSWHICFAGIPNRAIELGSIKRKIWAVLLGSCIVTRQFAFRVSLWQRQIDSVSPFIILPADML